MNSTLELLTTAARQLEIPFSFVNGATHLIQFDFGSKPYYFCWGTHPFESMVKSNIFKNKALCQELLEDIVQMPPSRTFYKNEASTKEILAKAEALFGYPLIVKPCNGTLARNVRFCNNAKEAEKAVNAIFYNNTDV